MNTKKNGAAVIVVLAIGITYFFYNSHHEKVGIFTKLLNRKGKVTSLTQANSEFAEILGTEFYSGSKLYSLKSLKEDLIEMKEKGVQ